MDGVRRRTYFVMKKKQEKLHLLKGLKRILLDIDKAIRVIRETEMDSEVVPNLMIEFGIDEVQANFVAEIKLRNINKEYILKQTKAISQLEQEIADMRATLESARKLKNVIIKELQAVSDKFGQPRKTEIIYDAAETAPEDEGEEIPDYPVTVFVSKEGYLKKITAQSLRMSGEQKFKEGDSLAMCREATNRAELLVFTDKFQVYKTRCSEFEDSKASVLGDFLPAKRGMDEGENVLAVCLPGDYKGSMLFVFENGKAAKVDLSAYETKSNRRKLTGAYSDKSPVRGLFLLKEDDKQVAVYASDGRCLIFSTAQLAVKTTRNTIGVAVMALKKNKLVEKAVLLEDSAIQNPARYRAKALPAAGAILKGEDVEEKQITMEL